MQTMLNSANVVPDEAGFRRAVEVLRAGGLAALPTETVYGLAADAANPLAVAKIYATKQRPQFNPLIAHVATLDQVQSIGKFNQLALLCAEKFWPGPLTLVLPYQGNAICDLARAGLDTIALRIPSHPAIRAVLSEYGGPLVAPSANRSGHVSATSAAHVAADFGNAIDIIIDGGPTEFGLESTIIDATTDIPVILREGAISVERLEKMLGRKIEHRNLYDLQNPSSPGQLSAHYATTTPLRLNAAHAEAGEALLAFGKPLAAKNAILNLSENSDLGEAAANLFAHLRALDETGAKTIAVMPVPDYGLGAAINDRLRRAALGSNQ